MSRAFHSGHEKSRKPFRLTAFILLLVPRGRLELPRHSALPPQDSVSTNSTTWAQLFLYSKAPCLASIFFPCEKILHPLCVHASDQEKTTPSFKCMGLPKKGRASTFSPKSMGKCFPFLQPRPGKAPFSCLRLPHHGGAGNLFPSTSSESFPRAEKRSFSHEASLVKNGVSS